MTLSELGAKLKLAREERRMAVDEVLDRFKISPRILENLEEGTGDVPHTVHVRQFIKEYARLLGFKDDEISEWVKDLKGVEGVSCSAAENSASRMPMKSSMLSRIFGALCKVILVGIVAYGVYAAYMYFFTAGESESIPVTEPSAVGGADLSQSSEISTPPTKNSSAADDTAFAPPVSAEPPEPSAITSDAVSGETSASASQNLSEESAPPLNAPEADFGGSDVSVSRDEPVFQEESSSAAEAPSDMDSAAASLPEGMHRLDVIAEDGDCWVGFEPDGRQQQQTLRRGENFSITFRNSLDVRFGNVQAVRIIYDGKELPRSTSARVVTMSFPMLP